MKNKLSLLLVLSLIVSLLTGLTLNAAAADDTIYLAFTSDIHYDPDPEVYNPLNSWMDSIKTVAPSIDYLGVCGDLGSAYSETTDEYWSYVQAGMDIIDGYKTSGFIKNDAIFTFGNHEWYPSAGGDYTNNNQSAAAKRLIHIGEGAKTDDYIIYCFGAAETSRDHKQEFLDKDIAVLEAYLKTAPKDIPIFILTHFPLDTAEGRTSVNADKMVALLNQHPNVVLLWGHNHNVNEIYYDEVYTAGDTITIGDGADADINFTYCAAGAMADADYTRQSAAVKGKGLLVSITGSLVTFKYYDLNGNPLPYDCTVDISKAGPAAAAGPFTVTFLDNLTGKVIDTQTVESGAGAKEPAAPEYEGYEFVGWNREFSKVAGNMIVRALYEPIPDAAEKLAAQSALSTDYVYITLTLAGGPAVGKSGKPIVLYPVPWAEGMTVVDAVTKLHELEYTGGGAGVVADNPYGFYCFTEIWGTKPVYNTLAFDSEDYLDAAAVTEGGDVYYFMAYDDTWLTTSMMGPCKTETVAGKYVAMQAQTMNMNPDYSYSKIGFAADIYAGTSLNSLTDTGLDSNENGYFAIGFDKPGTYYVVAKDPTGKHSDATAIVTVTANAGQYVYVNLSVDGVLMNDKLGNYIVHYPMVLQEGETINDIMTELHAYAYGRGSAWSSFDSGGFVYVGAVWGLVNSGNCGGLFLNDQNEPASGSTVLKNGDQLFVNGYSDFSTFAHNRGAMFDVAYKEIPVGGKITLTAVHKGLNLQSFKYDMAPLAGAPVYVNFVRTGNMTDDNGKVTLSFNKAGTYIVTAKAAQDTTCPAAVIKVGRGGPMVKGPAEPEPVDAVLVKKTVNVDGVDKVFEVYSIEGADYYKLRDLAYVVNGTGSQFSISYDAAKKAIFCTTGEAYAPVGGELVVGADRGDAVQSSWSLTVDGKAVKLTGYILGGNHFFKLSDMANALKFNASVDETAGTVTVKSIKKADHSGSPSGTVYFYAVVDTDIATDKDGKQIVYYPVPIWKDDTIADAITTFHETAYGDGSAWGYEQHAKYGYVLNKMLGVACADMAYGGGIWTDFSKHRHADITAPVTDGMIIYLSNFTGSLYMRTGYFDKPYAELKAGESLELTFYRGNGDGVGKPCTGAAVSIDGAEAGTTDDNAKITLKFDKAGSYVVTGAGKDSYGTAVCYVVVR
jgi:hypothetical protein